MNNNLEPNNKIVLDLDNKSDSVLFIRESSVKIEVFVRKMKHFLSTEGFKDLFSMIPSIANLPYEGSQWFNQGVSCQLLEVGKGWRKGKVKINITLEFIPDEPETETNKNDSVLDDIRQSMN